MKALLRPIRRYADFTGRASRREFWLFAVFFVAANLAANYFDSLDGERTIVAARMGMAELIVTIVLFLPIISCGARRLHDSDRSGWCLLLVYMPYAAWVAAAGKKQAELLALGALALGFVALCVLLLWPGTNGANRHGLR